MLLLAGAAPALSPDVPAPSLRYESFDPREPPPPVVEQVARRYRIGATAAERTVNAAYLAAYEAGVDPLLVVAVIGVESSFNPAADPSSRYARKVLAERDLLLRQTYE